MAMVSWTKFHSFLKGIWTLDLRLLKFTSAIEFQRDK